MSSETVPNTQISTADVTSPIVSDGNPQPVVSSPIVENNPAPPVTEVVPAVETTTETVPDPNASKSTPEWAQKRINELTAKRYEAERTAKTERDARLAAEANSAELLAQISKPGAVETPPANKPAVTEEEIERRVAEKAELLARANEFNRACNDIVETGKKEFTATWDEAVKNLGLVGAIGKDVAPDFLETAIELKNPAKILHYLGQNLEEAEKIAKLPPKRMAMEMARVEALLNAPPPAPAPVVVSNAPAPVIPVGGAAKPGNLSIDDPNLSGEEWMALRAKQVAERKNRYNRV